MRLLSILLLCGMASATINVPLTIEEALYPGDPTGTTTSSRVGIARTTDPVTVGVPLPNDANGVNSITLLSLTGATGAWQMRVLSCWSGAPSGTPATSCTASGNIKWVLIDLEQTVSAGALNTAVSLVNVASGGGNSGGSNLATDNGTTITVSTNGGTCGAAGSAICFTIQKANTDIFHLVQIGATTLVSAGASGGLVITGPANPGTSCGTCTTAFASTNDASSTAVIEENGPAKAVVKITTTLTDNASHTYLPTTTRLYFYAGKSYVRIVDNLRNAAYGASSTFASAFKGMASYELRIKANISGTLNWQIAGDSSVCTSGLCSGTMSGTDYAYLYQGQSNAMTGNDIHVGTASGTVAYTPDIGYTIRKSIGGVTSSPATGDVNHYPTGWADIADGSGNGMLIGFNNMATLGPKSLEFDAGGSDVRLGIWASENGNPTGGPGAGTSFYYQAWQERKIHEMYVEFHASAPASPANDYLKLLLPLVGHAPYTLYNCGAGGTSIGGATCALSTGSSFPLINKTVEDNFFASAAFTSGKPAFGGIAFTMRDLGTDGNVYFPLRDYQFYNWEVGGGGNQIEFHWSEALNFIRRDYGASWLSARNWYRFAASEAVPFLDGDVWSAHTGDLDGQAYPQQLRNGYNFVYGAGAVPVTFSNGSAVISGTNSYGAGQAIQLVSTGTLPTNFTAALTYYVIATGLSGSQFELSTTPGGGAIVAGSAGTGSAAAYQGSCCRQDLMGQEHAHAYGIYDYYVMSGDENVHDAFGGFTDLFTTTFASYFANQGSFCCTRAIGIDLMWAARLHNWLISQNDTTNATKVFTQADNVYALQVHPDLCVSGYPVGCTFGGSGNNEAGVSRVRGAIYGVWQNLRGSAGAAICGNSPLFRFSGGFQPDILEDGLWQYRNERGSGWTYFIESLDLLYGITQFSLTEDFYDDGTIAWSTKGSRYYLALDVPNNSPRGCAATGNTFDYYNPGPNNAADTSWIRFFIQNQYNGSVGWKSKLLTTLQRDAADGANTTTEFGHYQLAQAIAAISTVPSQSLVEVTIPTDPTFSGGNYALTITVPTGVTASGYVIGCATSSTLKVVEWIGFDPGTNTFIGNPATQQNWFASYRVTGLTPTAGVFTVPSSSCGSQTNLTSAKNWMVKAWVSLPNNTWSTQNTWGVPSGDPGFSSLIFNPDLLQFCNWGNYHDNNSEVNDAWECYNIETNNWEVHARTEPYHDEHWPESGHQNKSYGVFDPINHVHLGTCCGSGSSGFDQQYSDWIWDLGADTGWNKQVFSPTGATVHPDAPLEPLSEYMPSVGSYTMLIGGRNVWSWTIGCPTAITGCSGPNLLWTNLAPACTKQIDGSACTVAPISLSGTATAFDPAGGCSWVFGGTDSITYYNLLFRGCYSGGIFSWLQMNTSGTPPSARGEPAMDVDTLNGVILVFGGSCVGQAGSCGESQGLGYVNDLFAYSIGSNSWTTLSPTGGPPPAWHGPFLKMAYDPMHNLHVYANGICTAPNTCQYQAAAPTFVTNGLNLTQTWFYRYAGGGPGVGITQGASPAATGGNVISAFNPFISEVQAGSRTHDKNGWAQRPSLTTGNSLLWLGRSELDQPFSTAPQTVYPTPYVDVWNGSSWATYTVSLAGNCNGSAALWYGSTAAYVGGKAWLATYGTQGNNRLLLVGSASGTTFSLACSNFPIQGSSTGGAGSVQFADVGGVAYLADIETNAGLGKPTHNQIYVYTYNGTSWVLVGSNSLNASGTATSTGGFSIQSDGSHPCVAWSDYVVDSGDVITSQQAQVHLSCFVSGAWTVRGGGPANITSTNYATDPTLTYIGSTPYVCFTERTLTGNAQLYCRHVNGSGAWVTDGSSALNTDTNGNGWAFHASTATDGTNLYLGWTEVQAPHNYIGGEPAEERSQAYVSKWNGTSWSALGGTINADYLYGSAQSVSIAYYSGAPHACWNEQDSGSSTSQVYCYHWTGSAWAATVNTGGITPTALNGVPYTATQTVLTTTFTDSSCGSPTWSIANGPSGLSINSGTGVLSGTLGSMSAGTYASMTVSDTCNTASISSFVVNPVPTVTLCGGGATCPTATLNLSYSQTVTVSGGTGTSTCAITAGTLSGSGLTLNSNCTITGTAAAIAVYTFTVTATDANSISGPGTQFTLSVVVACSVPSNIGFDRAADGGWNGNSTTSLTWTHTILTTNTPLLAVCLAGDSTGGNDDITSVKYAGVSMTLAAKHVSNSPANNNHKTYLYLLPNAPTGSNTVSVTAGSAHTLAAVSVSYAGSAIAGQPDNASDFPASSSSPYTTSLTTVADSAWMILCEGGAPQTAGAGSTQRVVETSAGIAAIYDSNAPITPPASYSMATNSAVGTADDIHIMASISRYAPGTCPVPVLGAVTSGAVTR